MVRHIAAERGGEVPHLYRMLLHSPPVAAGWLRYLSSIRVECQLRGDLRELAVMRVAVINGAAYEADLHRPIALREGLSAEQISALRDWERSELFDEAQRAVLAYVDAMTRNVHVPEPIFRAVRDTLDNRELVELTATVAAYNMVSRFLEALGIDVDDP